MQNESAESDHKKLFEPLVAVLSMGCSPPVPPGWYFSRNEAEYGDATNY
jgi:hypothetical protein